MAGKSKPTRVLKPKAPKVRASGVISGKCLCGAVEIETDAPVFWAWHDHSAATRRAHGASYATYVGCWRSKVRVKSGEAMLASYDDAERGQVRSFCSRCGTPVLYARGRASKMINIPRALFAGRTGREAKYHVAIEELQDWAYLGAPVGPLKGYPGVSVEKARKQPKAELGDLFDPEMFATE